MPQSFAISFWCQYNMDGGLSTSFKLTIYLYQRVTAQILTLLNRLQKSQFSSITGNDFKASRIYVEKFFVYHKVLRIKKKKHK